MDHFRFFGEHLLSVGEVSVRTLFFLFIVYIYGEQKETKYILRWNLQCHSTFVDAFL